MTRTNAVSGTSNSRSPETTPPDVERPAKTPTRTVPRSFVPGLTSIDEQAAATWRDVVAQRTPFVLGDLSLYTPDALEREIDAARARLASAKGPAADSEGQLIDRAEAELAHRAEPVRINPDSYRTSAEVDAAIAAESKFLARFRRCVSAEVVATHERHLEALQGRRETFNVTENACATAKPTVVAPLRHGAAGQAVTADDLVAAVKAKAPLDSAEEARLRSAFEAWRQGTCLATGTDPTHFVGRNQHQEAKIDRAARAQEEGEKFLEMIEAIRGSAFATAAFIDSTARGDTLDAALGRVRAATVVSEVAFTLPTAVGVLQRPSPEKAEHHEVQGLRAKITDDHLNRGHAANTRFRDVDNTKFVKDPDKIRFGPYRPNRGNTVRTLDEARAIYEKQTGRKIPAWVKIVIDDKMPPDRDAMYALKNNAKLDGKFESASLTGDGVTVRLRSSVLASDESIVGHISHEMWELESLAKMAEEHQLTNGKVRKELAPAKYDDPTKRENLHGQAWNVADLEVLIMRADPKSREHAELVKRRDMLIERLDARNLDPMMGTQ